MKKIYKIANIALIFTLIGVVLCQNLAYSSLLRVPFGGYNRLRNVWDESSDYRVVSRPSNLGRIAPAPKTRDEARRFRYAVLGVGPQGTAVAYDLASQPDTREIILVDLDIERARKVAGILPISKDKVRILEADLSKADSLRQLFQDSDVVIGAAHYALNAGLARVAAETGAHFVDMGGNTAVVLEELSHAETAIKNGAAIIPDMGLAPGMAGLLALDGISEMDVVNDVKIRVGGLPLSDRDKEITRSESPNIAFHNPLRYRLVFSILGLINEYMGEALAIRDGQVVAIPTFGEGELFTIEPAGENQYEAFPTSGGTSTLPYTLTSGEFAGKVKNLDYMTIRYAGHADIIQAFIEMGFFDETETALKNKKPSPFDFFSALAREKDKGSLFNRNDVWEAMRFLGILDRGPMQINEGSVSPRQLFAQLASKALEVPDEKDKIVILVRVSGEKDGQPKTIEYYYDLSMAGDYGRQFSEMERTTAFPVSIVALMLARREIQYVGAAGPERFVPTAPLIEELRKRGVGIRKQSIPEETDRAKKLEDVPTEILTHLEGLVKFEFEFSPAVLSDKEINPEITEEQIFEILKERNVFCRTMDESDVIRAAERVKTAQLNIVPYIHRYWQRHYPEEKIMSISLYGSLPYTEKAKDIDLIIIVGGNKFDGKLRELPVPEEIEKVFSGVKGISCLPLGYENISEGKGREVALEGTLSHKNFLEENVPIFYSRNIPLWGRDFNLLPNKEQGFLVMAVNLLSNAYRRHKKIGYIKEEGEKDRISTIFKRTFEAAQFLNLAVPSLKINIRQMRGLSDQLEQGIIGEEEIMAQWQKIYEKLKTAETSGALSSPIPSVVESIAKSRTQI